MISPQRVTIRSILFASIVLNFIGIALSEVQRRALVYKAVETDQKIAQQLEIFERTQAELKSLQERQAHLLAWHDTKLDRVAVTLLVGQGQQSSLQELVNRSRERDAQRIQHLRMLKTALDRYRAKHGVFPGPFADNSIGDLREALVDGHYLAEIPIDPLGSKEFRYTTDGALDRQRYGLKVALENGGDCLTGIGFEGAGWWGELPSCPF